MSDVKTYRKNPIDISAVKFDVPHVGSESLGGPWSDKHQSEFEALLDFTDHLVRTEDYHDGAKMTYVYDRLHDTWVKFYAGDYILRGTEGEFYPHNGELFEKNYKEQGKRFSSEPGKR